MMGKRFARGALGATLAVLATAAVAHGPPAGPAPARLDPDQSLDISQRALGRAVGNHRLVGIHGEVNLSEFRGKPLVISLIYTGCTHVCPMITQRVRQAIQEAQRMMGPDRFNAVTVGFDHRNDTPARMAAYARAQGIDLPNWGAYSADEATVAALSRDLGFTFVASGGGFLHTAQVTLVDADGRVYRQVYGDDFPIQVFMEPLKEAVYGTVTTLLDTRSLIDRFRFLCTVYDPNQGRYRFSYAIVMSFLTGVISLGATAVVLSRAWLNSRRA